MSTNNPDFNSDTFKTNGQWTSSGSTNAGIWQSNTNQPLSPQQHGESSASWQTRQSTFDYAEKQKNGGY